MSTVARIISWLKEHKRELAISFLIFLIATTSFALGYLFGRDMTRAPIVIEKISP